MNLQAGGALGVDAAYVARTADDELFEALGGGEYAFVLAPRQVGKTSLAHRARRRLRALDPPVVAAYVTLLSVGDIASDDLEWVRTLCRELARDLGLPGAEAPADARTVSACLRRFVREALLPRTTGDVVVFIDEVNRLRGTGVGDAFLGALRSFHDSRGAEPAFERITFCLLGFVRPEDLISDLPNSPFQVGRRIDLGDFTREEARGFEPLVAGATGDPAALVDAAWQRTHGHPYMLQKLLQAAVAVAPFDGTAAEHVRKAERRAFPTRGPAVDTLLLTARAYLLEDSHRAPSARLLERYRDLLEVPGGVPTEGGHVADALVMGGLAAYRGDDPVRLAVRNPLYAEAIDAAWVDKELARRPFAEAASRWEHGGQSRSDLPGMLTMQEMLRWSEGRDDLTAAENQFLRASLRWQRGSLVVIGIGLMGLVALIAAIGLYVQTQRMAEKAQLAHLDDLTELVAQNESLRDERDILLREQTHWEREAARMSALAGQYRLAADTYEHLADDAQADEAQTARLLAQAQSALVESERFNSEAMDATRKAAEKRDGVKSLRERERALEAEITAVEDELGEARSEVRTLRSRIRELEADLDESAAFEESVYKLVPGSREDAEVLQKLKKEMASAAACRDDAQRIQTVPNLPAPP